MPLANYTTTVTAAKSIAEIQGMLVAHGAKHILVDYDAGEPTGLAFIIGTAYGDMPFRLPANIGKVEEVLLEQVSSSSFKKWDRQYQQQRRAKMKGQAKNVAWRILRDWVRAQMAILETEMVTIDQIFLPYMQVGSEQKSLYEVMRDHRFQLRGPEKA